MLDELPSLPAGGTAVIHTATTMDNNTRGTFNTIAMVDPFFGVAELNEDNNRFTQPLTVGICDFSANYNSDKSRIQTALNTYMARHGSSIPVTYNSVQLNNPSGTYHIIDICALIGSGDLLPEVPASCVDSPFDNCEANTCSCKQNARYIWLVDSSGNVLSTCIGGDCDTNFVDGYQGVWP